MTATRLLALLGTLLVVLTSCSQSGESGGATLSDGDSAPNFSLPSASGDEVALADFSEKRPVLLSFSMGPG